MEQPPTPTKPIAITPERIALFLRLAKSRSDSWKHAIKAVARLLREQRLADLTSVRKAAQGLSKLDLAPARQLGEELAEWAEHETRERRYSTGRELLEAFRALSIEVKALGGEPPVFQAGIAQVELDHEHGKAVIRYAREVVAETVLSVPEIVKAHQAAIESLHEVARPPAQLHAQLLRCYKAFLARNGLVFGDRIDAVDLVPEMALEVQTSRFRADPIRARFTSYSRAQFAFDLAALVRAGMLSHDGLRLDIGPATMGSTAKKQRVLWLEIGPAGGQYHGSLRFIPETGGTP